MTLMTRAHATDAAAEGTEAGQRLPDDDPVPAWDALDRLREAAAAHDDELPAFSAPWIPERKAAATTAPPRLHEG